MLPGILSSSYKQYKEKTDHVASWLASTAARLGFPKDVKLRNDLTSQGPRLKGKARKQAKQSKGDVKPDSSAIPQYTIQIKDFLPLAQYIVAHLKPAEYVPAFVFDALEQTIALRKDVSEHFGAAKSENDRHWHFVQVLESVRDTLKAHHPPATSHREALDHDTPRATPAARLTSLFSFLEVQDPAEPLGDTAGRATHAQASAAQEHVIYLAETPDDIVEAFIALVCLLKDFSRIRYFIINTWLDFRDGRWDLVSAAITSNTALELARHLEGQASVLRGHGGPVEILQMYFVARCLSEECNSKPTETFNLDEMMIKSAESYRTAESCYMPAYVILAAYQKMYNRNILSVYKPGTLGKYDPTADRSQLTPAQKFAEDKLLLSEALPSFNILAMTSSRLPEDDEFVRGVLDMFDTGNISLSLLLSAQVYLDLNHHLRGDIGRPFAGLSSISDAAADTVRENLKFHEHLKIVNWPSRHDVVFENILDYIRDNVKEDPIQRAVKKFSKELADKVEQHYLPKHYPIRCGLSAYYVKFQLHHAAVNFAKAWGSIMFTAHLYNALQKEKLLLGRWTDMDLLLTVQDTDDLFVGSMPTSAEDYLMRFYLAIGYSATNFARDRRSNQPRGNARGPRTLKLGADVSRMFVDKYINRSGQNDMTAADVEKILEKGLWKDQGDGCGLMIMDKQVKANGSAKAESARARTKLASIPDLLFNLRIALCIEVVEFSFDYLLLHRQCWRLLRNIKEVTQPLMTDMFGAGYLEQENQLPFLIGYVLASAVATKKAAKIAGQALGRRPGFEMPSDALLKLSANEFDKFFVRTPSNEHPAAEVVSQRLSSLYNIAFEIDEDD